MKFNWNVITKNVAKFGKIIYAHRRGLLKTGEIVTGVGVVAYAVKKTPEAVHAVEEAGMKKGEPLTAIEKTTTVMSVMWPVAVVGGVHVAFRTGYDISTAKQIKAVTATNKGLIEQITEMSAMYSTMNDIKGAISKKLEEKYTPEEVDEIKQTVVAEHAKRMAGQVRTDSNGTVPYLVQDSRLNEWNDVYLRTGDSDYKVCTFLDMFTGQKFLSCRHAVYDARDTFKARLKDEETNRGYLTLNEWLVSIGAHTNDIGDHYLFRSYNDWFDITLVEFDDEGDLCWAIFMDNAPYYDEAREYM